MPLLAGDRVRTENGRVEVLFADGSTLHLDSQHRRRLPVRRGHPAARRPGPADRSPARAARCPIAVDAPAGMGADQRARRIPHRRSSRGERSPKSSWRCCAGRRARERGRRRRRCGPASAPSRVPARRPRPPTSSTPPPGMRSTAGPKRGATQRLGRIGAVPAGDGPPLRRRPSIAYGTWQYEQPYGYVWYPRVSASAGGRIINGRWASLRPFGWTWIGSDAWAWPTHHYGRWGFSAGRRGSGFPAAPWGPAWVSWAYAPGYVSWCPLGWDNRPVLQFVNVNYVRRPPLRPVERVDGRAAPAFRPGYVNVAASIGGARIDVRTRNAFVVRQSRSRLRGYAGGRSAAPIRTAAGTRCARSGTTRPAASPAGVRSLTAAHRAIGDSRRRAPVETAVGAQGNRASSGSRAGRAIARCRASAGRVAAGTEPPVRQPRRSRRQSRRRPVAPARDVPAAP